MRAGQAVVALGFALAGVLGCAEGFDHKWGAAPRRGSAAAFSRTLPAPPALRVDVPERGAHLGVPQTVVEGTVLDRAVREVDVGGQVVPVDPAGRWRATVPLAVGLNVIHARTRGLPGGEQDTSVGVLRGDFDAPGRPVERAVELRVSRGGFDTLARRLETMIAGPGLARALSPLNPIFQGPLQVAGVTVTTTVVDLLGTRSRSSSVRATPLAGRLEVDAVAQDMELDFEARSTGGLRYPDTRGVALVSRVHLAASFTVGVNAAGRLEAQMTNPVVDIQGVSFQVASGLPQWLVSILQAPLSTAVTDFVRRIFTQDLARIVAEGVARLGQPMDLTVQGRRLSFRSVRSVPRLDADGLLLDLSLDVDGGIDPTLPARPGSLVTAGAPPVLQAAAGAELALDDDLVNRALYVAWRAGLLAQTIDASTFAGNGNPGATGGTGLRLEGSLLTRFLPEFSPLVRPTDPIAFRLRPLMPPVVLMDPADPRPIRVAWGEVHMDVLVDRGSGYEKVLTVAVHLRAGLELGVLNGSLVFNGAVDPSFYVDVVDQPVAAVDERRVQVLVGMALPPALPILGQSLSRVQLSLVPGLALQNVQVGAGGPTNDHVRVHFDF
ncbi:MAG: hypothetical protein HY722_13190 [Planctomycetes bacterium]|nr:hypothetical protein [Planctomycetota bacterium]